MKWPSHPALDSPSMSWLIAAGLAVLTFALFSPALGYGFIDYDDCAYVPCNAHVTQGLGRDGIAYAFHSSLGAIWMPLTWLSYMLDTSVFGTAPAGYHFTNILLHSLSAGLLFLGLQKLTRRTLPALCVAALFAWHPQRLESVAWIAERKDVLSVFFWMLGLLAYAGYAARPGWLRMTGVTVCLILAIMAKPVAVSFPVVLLLLDFWPLQRFGATPAEMPGRIWPLIREKIHLFLVSGLMGVLAIRLEATISPAEAAPASWPLKLGGTFEHLWFYVHTFFLPLGMAIVHPIEPLVLWHMALVTLLLLAITLAVLREAWRRPWLVLGWFWFLITILPLAGIRSGNIAVADRYNYLPSAGLAIAVVFAAAESAIRRPRIRLWAAGGLVVWPLVCAIAMRDALPCWRDTFTVFINAYRNGKHFLAADRVAALLYVRHDFQNSILICNQALTDHAWFASLYNTRGDDYYMLGDLNKAMADFDEAIKMDPGFSAAYYGRALGHMRRQEFAAARTDAAEYVKRGGKLDVQQFMTAPSTNHSPAAPTDKN